MLANLERFFEKFFIHKKSGNCNEFAIAWKEREIQATHYMLLCGISGLLLTTFMLGSALINFGYRLAPVSLPGWFGFFISYILIILLYKPLKSYPSLYKIIYLFFGLVCISSQSYLASKFGLNILWNTLIFCFFIVSSLPNRLIIYLFYLICFLLIELYFNGIQYTFETKGSDKVWIILFSYTFMIYGQADIKFRAVKTDVENRKKEKVINNLQKQLDLLNNKNETEYIRKQLEKGESETVLNKLNKNKSFSSNNFSQKDQK